MPLMWFCLLCTSGVNIFGIAFQVPFGERHGLRRRHRRHGHVAEGHRQRHRPRRDRLAVRPYGRKQCLIFVCVVLGLAQFGVLLSGEAGSMPLFLLCSMVSGFGGGAIFPLFAALTADYFGENNNATNYGMVYSSKLVSGLAGAGLGSWSSRLGATAVRSASRRGGISLFAGCPRVLFLRAPGRAGREPRMQGRRAAGGPGVT